MEKTLSQLAKGREVDIGNRERERATGNEEVSIKVGSQ